MTRSFGDRLRHAAGSTTDLALRVAPRSCVRAFGAYERRRPQSALALLDAVVRPGDTVVDVGAHRGVFTQRLASLVGPTGHVHAFEPNPDTWHVLSAVRGEAPGITLHPMGVSDGDGVATLFRPRIAGARVDAMGSLQTPGGRTALDVDPVAIRVGTLDAALAGVAAPISFVKIDVEGHELAVLRGAATVIDNSRPVILVEIEQRHLEGDISETFTWFDDHGYRGEFRTADGLLPLDRFDVRRHQLDLLPDEFARGRPAAGYVTDFMFTPR